MLVSLQIWEASQLANNLNNEQLEPSHISTIQEIISKYILGSCQRVIFEDKTL